MFHIYCDYKPLFQKLPKGLVSIMNKLTVGNLDSCVAAFKELVIETIDHLEMTVDFILKRVMYTKIILSLIIIY